MGMKNRREMYVGGTIKDKRKRKAFTKCDKKVESMIKRKYFEGFYKKED